MPDSHGGRTPRIAVYLALGLGLYLTTGATTAGAEIDARPVRTTDVKGTIVDVAVTPDGRRTYVLLSDGKVNVQDARGLALGTLEVGNGAGAISTSPDGSLLYVATGQQLQTIAVELVQDIDLAGSPFRGPADAPVAIVVFNDFQ